MTRAIHITTPDELEALADEIEAMAAANPETGERWAEICQLEAILEEMKREWARDNGQFGVGA